MQKFRAGYISWKSKKSLKNQSFQKSSENFVRRGVGVGVGEGVGDGLGEVPVTPKASPSSPIVLPLWIPEDAWNGFSEMRKKIRAPLTEHAITLTINELDKLRSKGFAPGDVLDQSTMKGWRGVFPIKPDFQGGNHVNGNGKNSTTAAASNLQTALRDSGFEVRSHPSGLFPVGPDVGQSSRSSGDAPMGSGVGEILTGTVDPRI
jgi:hypothetical protein